MKASLSGELPLSSPQPAANSAIRRAAKPRRLCTRPGWHIVSDMPTAVVIGSGPNGLAGAVTLAQAGFDVVVHEEQPTLGGGTRSAELTLPGFVHDLCSAIHPLARSPFFREVDLQLDWVEPALQTAHPFDDGTAAVLHRDVGETARGLGADERAYRRLFQPVVDHWAAVEPVLVGPYPPPPRRVLAMLRALGPRGAASRARLPSLRHARSPRARSRRRKDGPLRRERRAFDAPAREEAERGVRIRPHAARPCLRVGLSRGGSQRIAYGLVARIRDPRREVRVSSPVDVLPEADVVLADVMLRDLLRMASGRLPPRYAERSSATGTARARSARLGARRPDPVARRGVRALGHGPPRRHSRGDRRVRVGAVERTARGAPFVLLVQQSLFDDTRAPAGKHTAWAYCHVRTARRRT